jgi:hypothetical protein
MQLPLLTDLKNDSGLIRNLVKLTGFILIFILIDLVVSIVLLKGIERFYGLKSDSAVLMIGHSHLMLAVDKILLEKKSGLNVAKYTREGVNIADRRVMAEQYFSNCSSKPGVVILGIDPWLFTGEGLSKNSWQLFLPFMDNRDIDYFIKSSVPGRFDYLRYKFIRSSRFNAQLLNASARGWLKSWDNLKFGIVDTVKYNNPEVLTSFRRITFNRDLMKEFSSLLDFLKKEDVKVILLNTPLWKPILDAQQSDYKRSMFLIDSIRQVHFPGTEILDLVPEFSQRTNCFFDPIHMNPEGQEAVTEIVADHLIKDKNLKNWIILNNQQKIKDN